MANKSISLLPTAPDITVNDLMEVATPDVGSASGYISGKDSLGNVFNAFMTDFTEASLDTTDKTIVGAINEVATNAGGQNYTYTEQVVGTWVDGKPIYRRTYDMGKWSDSNKNGIYAVIPSVETVTRLWGTMYDGYWSTIPYIEPYALDASVNIFTLESNGTTTLTVRKQSTTYHQGANVYASIEFTKSTDSRVVTTNLFDEGTWVDNTAQESASVGSTWAQVGHAYTSTNKATSEELITCTGNYLSWDNTIYKIGIFYFDSNDQYTGVYEWLTAPQAFQNYPKAGLCITRLDGADRTSADFMANAHTMLNTGSSALPYIHY